MSQQPCPICREQHEPRGLSFDGKGVNSCGMYRARVATFLNAEQAAQLGAMFAAAPDLLGACQALVDGFTQAGIGPCKEEEDDEDDGTAFTPDERFNVRLGREAIRKAKGGHS